MTTLEEFSLETIKHDAVLLIIGGHQSGRTTLIRRILTHHSAIVRGTYLHEYTDEALRTLYEEQDTLRKLHSYDSLQRRAYLVLDNCMADNTWTQNRFIRTAFSFNRSMGLLFLLSTDVVKARAIPPVLKGEVDWICLFHEPDMTKRRQLHDRFIGDLCSFEQFCEWMDLYTLNYGCLVIDMVHDIVTWMRVV